MTKGAFGPAVEFHRVVVYNEQTQKDQECIIKVSHNPKKHTILHHRKPKKGLFN